MSCKDNSSINRMQKTHNHGHTVLLSAQVLFKSGPFTHLDFLHATGEVGGLHKGFAKDHDGVALALGDVTQALAVQGKQSWGLRQVH